MAIDDDTPSLSASPTPSSTIYNRSQTNPQQSSPTNTSNTNNNKPVSSDYIQSIRANFQSLDDVIQTYTSKDSSSTSGAVQSPSDNYKPPTEESVASSLMAVIDGANNNNNDDDDKDFVDIGNIKNNKNDTNNNDADEVQQLRGGTADEKEASVLVTSDVNNNDINSNRPSIDNSEISGATSISDYMPVSSSLPTPSAQSSSNPKTKSVPPTPNNKAGKSNNKYVENRRISWTRQNSYLLTSKTSNLSSRSLLSSNSNTTLNKDGTKIEESKIMPKDSDELGERILMMKKNSKQLSSTSLLTADSRGSEGMSYTQNIVENNDISLKSELQRMKDGKDDIQDRVQVQLTSRPKELVDSLQYSLDDSGKTVETSEDQGNDMTKKEEEDSSPSKSVMSPTSFNTDVTSETVGGTKIEELKIAKQVPSRPRNLPVPPPPPPRTDKKKMMVRVPSTATAETIGGTKIEEVKIVNTVVPPSQHLPLLTQPREIMPTTSSPSPRGIVEEMDRKKKKMVRVPSLPPPPPLVLSSIDEVRKSWSNYHSLSKSDSNSDQLDPRSYSNQTCLGKHELDTTRSSNDLADDDSGEDESSVDSDGSSIKITSDSTNSSMVGGATSKDNTTTTGGLLVVPTTSFLQKISDVTFNLSNTTSVGGNNNKPGQPTSSDLYPSDESDGNTISVKEEVTHLSINTNQTWNPPPSRSSYDDNSGGLSVGSSGSIIRDSSASSVVTTTSSSGASEASLLNPSIKFAECKDVPSPSSDARAVVGSGEEKKVSLLDSIDDYSDRTPRTSTPTLLDVIGNDSVQLSLMKASSQGLAVAVDSSFETPPTKNTTSTTGNNEDEEDVIVVQSLVTGEPLRSSFNSSFVSLNRGVAEDDQGSSILTHDCNGSVVLTREMLNNIIGCNDYDGTDDDVPVRGISESTPLHSNVQDEKSGYMNIPGSLKMPHDDDLVVGGGVVNSSPDSSLPDTYRRLDGVGLSSTYASTKVYGTYDIQTKQGDGKSSKSSRKSFRRRASIGSTTLASSTSNSAFTIYEDIDPVDSVVTGGLNNYMDKSVSTALDYSKRSKSMPRLDKPLAFLSRQQRPNISVPSSLNALPDWRSSSADVVVVGDPTSGSCIPLPTHPWMRPLLRSVQSETSSEPSSTAWKSSSTAEATSVSSRPSLLKQLSLKELQNVEKLLAEAKQRISTELLVDDTSGVEYPQAHHGADVDPTADVDHLPQELNENEEDDNGEEDQHLHWDKRSTSSVFDEQLQIDLADLEHSNSTTRSTVPENRRLSTVAKSRRLTDNYMDVVGQKLAGFYRPKSSRMKAGPPVSRPDEELRRLSSLSLPPQEEDTADDRIDLDVLLASMSEEEDSQWPERVGSEEKVMSQQLVVRQAIDPEEASFAVKERTLALFKDSLTRYAEAYKESGVPVISSDTTPTSSLPTKIVDLVPSTIKTKVYPECSTLAIYENKPIDTSQSYNGFRHTYITVDEEHRFLMLCAFLKRNLNAKIIIFFSTTKSSQYYCKLLDKLNFNVNSVHHGMSKGRFKKELMDFTRSSGGSILCLKSDVGMNIAIPPSTTWIVQFEPPSSPTEYIYRIGRISSESETNHKSKDPPRALLFLAPNQFGFLKYYKAANVKIYEYEVPKVKRIQKQVIKLVKDDSELSKLGRGAYRAYLDMYASHDYKDIYNIKDLDDEKVADTFGFEKIPYAWHVEEVSVQGDGEIVKKKGKKDQGSPKKKNEKKKKQKVTKKDTKTKKKVVVTDEKKVVTKDGNKEREGHVKKERSKSNFLLRSLQQIHEDKDKEKRKKAWEKKMQKERNVDQWKPVSNVSQWKPVVYEPQRSWMPGKKTWKASHVHADKMAPAWSNTDYVW